MISIKISHDDTNMVERMYYQYSADKDILSNLIQNGISINDGPGLEFKQSTENLFAELETIKIKLGKAHRPDNVSPAAAFTFNFADSTIEFQE